MADRFQRDVLQDLEYRLSWVYTVIKTAPMIGLLGTVIGMMAAFAKFADPNATVEVTQLAQDIQFALITTALGLGDRHSVGVVHRLHQCCDSKNGRPGLLRREPVP